MIVECPTCQLRYDVTGRPPQTKARCRCGTIFTLPRPSESARTLNCPQCGAACPPDRTKCEYCTAVLATVRCPRCFGLLFAGASHCQHCGAKIDEPARAFDDESMAARRCPRCAKSLVANLAGNTLLDQCNDCGGLWLDRTAFERIVEDNERQDSATLALGQLPPPLESVATSTVSYVKCPDCAKLMTRRNFGQRSGVIVDVCQAHGVWFDYGELPRIVDFVKRGGLIEARRREVEHLKEEARRAQSARDAARSPVSAGHYFDDARLASPSSALLISAFFSSLFD